MEDSIKLIQEERERQINAEGYTSKHDDLEINGELASAAAVYACPQNMRDVIFSLLWRWDWCHYKPDNTLSIDGRIRELVKAGALICAEIDRFNRMKKNMSDDIAPQPLS